MLFLMMQIGEDRYVLNTGQISEVLPMVQLKQIPQAPAGVAGAFNYRGAPVAVIDLVQLMLGRPARESFSTRLVLVSYSDPDGSKHRLGLITEGATDTIRLNPMDFGPCGVGSRETAYLGPVTADARGLIQWVDPSKILPPSISDTLFKDPARQ
ncbi:MAG: chemotaxis protein CheW [Vicinamibacterales bacterium]